MRMRVPARPRTEPLRRARAAGLPVSRPDDAREREARSAVPRSCLACACGQPCRRHAGAAADGVRVYRGPDASADAAALDAAAFTVGRDVVVSDAVDLATPTGQAVLAHELVHANRHADAGVVHRIDWRSVRDDVVWYYQAGRHDVYQPIRGETGSTIGDVVSAPFVWGLNALGSAANAITRLAATPDILMEAAGMSQTDRDAANFALMMSGVGEVAMAPEAMRAFDLMLARWWTRLRMERALAAEAPITAELAWGAPTRRVPQPGPNGAILGEASELRLLDEGVGARNTIWAGDQLGFPYQAGLRELEPLEEAVARLGATDGIQGGAWGPRARISVPAWAENRALVTYLRGREQTGQCATGVCALMLRDAGFTEATAVSRAGEPIEWLGGNFSHFVDAVNQRGSHAAFLRSIGLRYPGINTSYATREELLAALRAYPPNTRFVVMAEGRTAQHAMYAMRTAGDEVVLLHAEVDVAGVHRTLAGAEVNLRAYTNFRFRPLPPAFLDWLATGQGSQPRGNVGRPR